MNLDIPEPRLVPWLEPPQMDTSSPMPAVHSGKRGLLCAYHISERIVPGDVVALLRFEVVLHFRFGDPNDEALRGHPLHKFGLESYRAYTVENSPLLAEIENQDRVHSHYKPGMFAKFRHWIITFHDETLEVVAHRAVVVGRNQLPAYQAVCEG